MILLSRHAREKLMDRPEIRLERIVETVAAPHWTHPDDDPTLLRSFKVILAFGGRVLRVVSRQDDADVVVVTAFFDRGARRP
jgi:Domain of unknown function (DUF4258)